MIGFVQSAAQKKICSKKRIEVGSILVFPWNREWRGISLAKEKLERRA